MGILNTDLSPLASYGPTVQTPAAHGCANKFFRVSRTDLAASVKVMLPASATIMAVYLYGSINSDAATSATVTLSAQNNGGVFSMGTYDVKANGATTGIVQMSALPNIQPIPAMGDIKISAQYAEAGTASTTGGPWIVRVEYTP